MNGLYVSELRIKLNLVRQADDRLRAFATIAFNDALVIRDCKVIEAPKGLFVAMPSRKLSDRCDTCGSKNCLASRYCNQCGGGLPSARCFIEQNGHRTRHSDIVFPTHPDARGMIEDAVLAAYHGEVARSQEPGYMPEYEDAETDQPIRRAEIKQDVALVGRVRKAAC
jgi:stage V sporulation protein G